jgi:hypothetical protein
MRFPPEFPFYETRIIVYHPKSLQRPIEGVRQSRCRSKIVKPTRWIVNRLFPVAFFLLSGLLSAVPPRVVRTRPENGDMNVRPGLTEIRIVFSQDMSHAGYSLSGPGDRFPEIVGEPRWAGRRIFSLTANLEPDRDYQIHVNYNGRDNFRNVSGEPAEPCRIFLKTAASAEEGDPVPSEALLEQNRAAYEKLRQAVLKFYSYRDMKKIDWSVMFRRYEQRLLGARSAEEFAHVTALLLEITEDLHIKVRCGDKEIYAYERPVRLNINPDLLGRLIPNFAKKNEIVWTGRFPEGIGYLYIDTWHFPPEKITSLYEALRELADTHSLIVDVRANSGGYEINTKAFAGCFTDRRIEYARQERVNFNDPNGSFLPVSVPALEPTPGAPKYRGNVAVLIGEGSASASESFALMMERVPGGTTVGELTRGTSGFPVPHDLGNGVIVHLPSCKSMLPDGRPVEDYGVKPEVRVRSKPEEFAYTDPVLAKAVELLRKQRMLQERRDSAR